MPLQGIAAVVTAGTQGAPWGWGCLSSELPRLPPSLSPGMQPCPGSCPEGWGECRGTDPAGSTRTAGFLQSFGIQALWAGLRQPSGPSTRVLLLLCCASTAGGSPCAKGFIPPQSLPAAAQDRSRDGVTGMGLAVEPSLLKALFLTGATAII